MLVNIRWSRSTTVNLRWSRPYSRCAQGMAAAWRRRSRRDLDRLRAMRLNRERLAQVACGREGHLPVGWPPHPDVCELCCKVLSPVPAQRRRYRQQNRQQMRFVWRPKTRNPLESLARPERLELPTF